MSKQFNRHQEVKALFKARQIAKKWFAYSNDPEKIEKCARRIRKNRTPCSCEMCRNPRTAKGSKGKEKITLQERKTQNWRKETDEQ